MPSHSVPLRSQLTRFVAVGGANTAFTYLIMLALTGPFSRAIAYTTAFAIGVACHAVVTGPIVFAARPGLGRVIGYAAWLGVVYIAGLAALRLATELQVRPMPLALASPFLVTVPLSFVGARLIVGGANLNSNGM